MVKMWYILTDNNKIFPILKNHRIRFAEPGDFFILQKKIEFLENTDI